jgi:hypothetical protein
MSDTSTQQAGIALNLTIGQRVRHRDYKGQRVTGTVRGLSIAPDRVLDVDILLDAPIVIPASGLDDREVSIWHQRVPAHELAPFDEREELIAGLLSSLQALLAAMDDGSDEPELVAARAAVAKATGATS